MVSSISERFKDIYIYIYINYTLLVKCLILNIILFIFDCKVKLFKIV
jgi:hypothetical protein